MAKATLRHKPLRDLYAFIYKMWSCTSRVVDGSPKTELEIFGLKVSVAIAVELGQKYRSNGEQIFFLVD
jgi:hypothetical protein